MILINQTNGWAGYSYEWDADRTDATLLTTGKTSTTNNHSHTFPSRDDCTACHTQAANVALGPEHAQLNYHDETLGGNLLDYLSELNYFTEPQSSTEQDKLVSLDDPQATTEQKARSYLHSNCSGCHRPGGPSADIDLRYNTSFASMNLCGVASTASPEELGMSEQTQRIMPGNPNLSELLLRMQTLDPNVRMPRLGTNFQHEQATQVIADWISSIQSCNN